MAYLVILIQENVIFFLIFLFYINPNLPFKATLPNLPLEGATGQYLSALSGAGTWLCCLPLPLTS